MPTVESYAIHSVMPLPFNLLEACSTPWKLRPPVTSWSKLPEDVDRALERQTKFRDVKRPNTDIWSLELANGYTPLAVREGNRRYLVKRQGFSGSG